MTTQQIKRNLDKYYTDKSISIDLIEKTLDLIGRDSISKIIEPSAGNGSFSNYLFDNYSDNYKIEAYDIVPEEDRILQQDFLKLYSFFDNRCLIIGNPPFGKRNNLALQFLKKSVELAKYVAFILPINQLNDSKWFYQANLIYSQDIGKSIFSGKKLHCCYNIYQAPVFRKNKKLLKISGISIIRSDNRIKRDILDPSKIDLTIRCFGNFKILSNDYNKSDAFRIIIDKPIEIKKKILEVISTYDWNNRKKFISMPSISMSDIYEVLIKEIPELKKENELYEEFFNF